MKRNICLLIVAVFIITNLIGCKYVMDVDINPDARVAKQEFSVSEFDLGKSTVQDADGKEIPYSLMGVIGVPKVSKNCPIVFIMHDVTMMSVIDKSRFDTGYSYLVSELASYGFLAISINVNAQLARQNGKIFSFDRLTKIFSDHFDKLKDAISGGKTSYGIDVAGAGDISRLALIGQGQSGQGAMVIADKYKDIVAGELLIDPQEIIDLGGNYPDVNTGIIIPQFSGDAMEFYGQDVFEDLRRYSDRTKWASYAFLYDTNGDDFNTMLSSYKYNSKESIISSGDSQKFLKNYAVDFMSAAFMVQNKPAMLMLSEFNKKDYYGQKVMTAFTAANKLVLADEKKGSLHPKNASVSVVVDSKDADKNTDGYFVSPIKALALRLYNVIWDNTDIEENTDSYATAYITEADKDLTAYKYISLYMAVDPTDEKNDPNKKLTISIRIKDKNKKESIVPINQDARALNYQIGELKPLGSSKAWSAVTPLGNVFIPLYLFKTVDLKNVATVEIVFGKGNKGALMVGELSAVPALNAKDKK